MYLRMFKKNIGNCSASLPLFIYLFIVLMPLDPLQNIPRYLFAVEFI